MNNPIITQKRLHELFDYDGNKLLRKLKVRPNPKIAGGYDSAGYICVRVNYKTFKAHRLIWLYVYGEWPKGEIDHINGIKDDNRIENLRDVSKSINQRNSKMRKNNTSGITGVIWDKANSKWLPLIHFDGKPKYLGRFDCKYKAASVRHLAMEIEGGYTNRHGA